MNPLLIQPAASVASTALHGATSIGATALATGAGASAGALNFQQALAPFQGGVSAQQLVGLKPADLQRKIASLSSDQQMQLAQQLMGATVAVTNMGGQISEGTASKLQIKNNTPVFQVAGQSYSLSQLISVLKTTA